MKHVGYILNLSVISCFLLLQLGCQEQAKAAEEPVQQLTTVETAISQPEAETKTENDESKSVPIITFESTVHDFGKIGPATKNICEFKFTNTGTGLLKVNRKIKATCGCTVPTLKKTDYASGESGTITVKYRAGKRPGSTTKHMYVSSNDPAKPKAKLTVKGRIALKVGYEPEKLNLLLNKENASCPDITLTSLDDQPFSIKQFKSTPDCITADYNSLVEATEFIIKPKVDIDKLKQGLNGRIDIMLTHPKCDIITIPFNALPNFKVTPASIMVLNAKAQEPTKKEIWVLNNYNENFEIESTSSNKNTIKVLGQQKIDNRYKLELEIVPPVTENNQKSFTDVFFINIKDGEKLQVKCRGIYSRTQTTRRKSRQK